MSLKSKIDQINTRQIARGAVTAALYAATAWALAPISFGPTQLRVSEALTVLPVLFPEAPYGLFVGCILANMAGGYGMLDIVFGSLATLLAAFATRKLAQQPFLALLPPVVINAVVIGCMLHFVAGVPFLLTAAQVGAGQIASCYGLGLPLLYGLKKTRLAETPA